MATLSEEIAELRNRAASACNETSRLIRQFCDLQAMRAQKASGATLRTEVGVVVQQSRRTAG